MNGVDSQILSSTEKAPSRDRPQRLNIAVVSGLFVGLWAASWRLLYFVLDGHTGFYFPDSWHYVVLPSNGGKHDALHGPMVYWLWDIAIPGDPAEWSVVLLQNTLGVFACVVLLFALREVVSNPLALACALVFGAFPLTIFFDRTLLTESVATFLAALLLLLALRLRHERHVLIDLTLSSLFGLAAGVLLAVRPATRFSVPIYIVLALALLIGREAAKSGSSAKRITKVCVTGTAVVCFALLAPLVLMKENEDQFGTFSLTPASGTVEISAWGWRIPCFGFGDYTATAQSVLLQLCEGDQSNQLWSDGPLHDSLKLDRDFADPRREFAESQRELSHEARKSLLSDPLFAAREALRNIRVHMFDPRLDLHQYHNGSEYFSEDIVRRFHDHMSWFGGDPTRKPIRGTPLIMQALRKTATLPGIAALLLVLTFVANTVVTLVRAVKGNRGWWAWNWDTDPLASVRTILAASCIGIVLAGEVAVGLSPWPIFRYWAPLMPAIVIGFGATLGQFGILTRSMSGHHLSWHKGFGRRVRRSEVDISKPNSAWTDDG